MIKTRTDKNVILNFCETLFSGSRRTWNKLNKRYRWIAKGVRLKKRAKIVVGIDTSGSMNSDSCRKQIVDQIEKLQPLCDELWICAGDTQLEWSLHIEDMNSFRPEMIQFEGGGGTNMQFVFDFAESIEADGIVLHTDGFVGTFDDKDIQTICYLYDHCEDVEGYENVRVYPE